MSTVEAIAGAIGAFVGAALAIWLVTSGIGHRDVVELFTEVPRYLWDRIRGRA